MHILTSAHGLEGPLPSNNASVQHTHHEGNEGYKPELLSYFITKENVDTGPPWIVTFSKV